MINTINNYIKAKRLGKFMLASCLYLASVYISENNTAAAQNSVKQMQSQLSLMKENLMAQRDKEVQAHIRSTQDKIQAINEAADTDIASVPQYYWNAWGYRVPNPNYESSVAYIRVEAEKKVNAVNHDLEAATRSIENVYSEKLRALNSSAMNATSQIMPGTSDVQMIPQGSNLYVKNYVNYAPDRPAISGLKASQGSLKSTKLANQKNTQ